MKKFTSTHLDFIFHYLHKPEEFSSDPISWLAVLFNSYEKLRLVLQGYLKDVYFVFPNKETQTQKQFSMYRGMKANDAAISFLNIRIIKWTASSPNRCMWFFFFAKEAESLSCV